MKVLVFSFIAMLANLFGALPIITVTASELPVLQKDIHVGLFDYGFNFSTSIKDRNVRLFFKNGGKNTHEVVVMKLMPGVTGKNFFEAGKTGASTTSLGKPVKNIPPLEPGDEWTLSLKLKPGHYILACFVADKLTGKSHMMLGMIHEFTVI